MHARGILNRATLLCTPRPLLELETSTEEAEDRTSSDPLSGKDMGPAVLGRIAQSAANALGTTRELLLLDPAAPDVQRLAHEQLRVINGPFDGGCRLQSGAGA